MIGLDTNVLVRLLTADDAAQADKALQFLAKNCSASDPAFVSNIVLAETFWVLQSVYAFKRDQIATAYEALFSTSEIRLEDEASARKALRCVVQDNADFADALIGAVHVSRGCSTTVTFDRKAAGLDYFRLLG